MNPVCQNFKKNDDSTWTCLTDATIQLPNGDVLQVSAGQIFTEGVLYHEIDIADWLNKNC